MGAWRAAIRYDQALVFPPAGNPGANLKSISHRCHLREVAFEWELTKETIYLALSCLQGGGAIKRLYQPPPPRPGLGGMGPGVKWSGDRVTSNEPLVIGGTTSGCMARGYDQRRAAVGGMPSSREYAQKNVGMAAAN